MKVIKKSISDKDYNEILDTLGKKIIDVVIDYISAIENGVTEDGKPDNGLSYNSLQKSNSKDHYLKGIL